MGRDDVGVGAADRTMIGDGTGPLEGVIGSLAPANGDGVLGSDFTGIRPLRDGYKSGFPPGRTEEGSICVCPRRQYCVLGGNLSPEKRFLKAKERGRTPPEVPSRKDCGGEGEERSTKESSV